MAQIFDRSSTGLARRSPVRVSSWMVFAKALDLFGLIQPNFEGAARNRHFSFGILPYVAVPHRPGLLHPVEFRSPRPNQRPRPTIILEPENAHA